MGCGCKSTDWSGEPCACAETSVHGAESQPPSSFYSDKVFEVGPILEGSIAEWDESGEALPSRVQELLTGGSGLVSEANMLTLIDPWTEQIAQDWPPENRPARRGLIISGVTTCSTSTMCPKLTVECTSGVTHGSPTSIDYSMTCPAGTSDEEAQRIADGEVRKCVNLACTCATGTSGYCEPASSEYGVDTSGVKCGPSGKCGGKVDFTPACKGRCSSSGTNTGGQESGSGGTLTEPPPDSPPPPDLDFPFKYPENPADSLHYPEDPERDVKIDEAFRLAMKILDKHNVWLLHLNPKDFDDEITNELKGSGYNDDVISAALSAAGVR